jgi:hypothetical protein
MKNPVLVRIRTTDVNRAEFTRQANESSVAQLSPLEQARADAARLKSIDDLVVGENGDVNSGVEPGLHPALRRHAAGHGAVRARHRPRASSARPASRAFATPSSPRPTAAATR